MPEKQQNKHGKFLKNGANPQGKGVLRFKVLEILEKSDSPLSVNDVRLCLNKMDIPTTKRTIGVILQELMIVMPNGRIIKTHQKKLVKTTTQVYSIQKHTK